jgi:FkbM family methyltransferase
MNLKSLISRALMFRNNQVNHSVQLENRRWIKALAKEVKTTSPLKFLDVGANAGQTLSEMKKFFPNSSVFCFEPDSNTFRQLSKAASQYDHAEVFQLALGDVSGNALLHRNRDSVTNSLLPNSDNIYQVHIAEPMSPVGNERVRVQTLTEWTLQQKIGFVDVLKTDCQGYDLRVLRGAGSLLTEKKIGWVCAEILFIDLYNGQSYADEILAFMRQHGYALYGFYELERDGEGRLTWGNALFKSTK